MRNTYREMSKDPTHEYNLEVENYLENMVKQGDITEKVK